MNKAVMNKSTMNNTVMNNTTVNETTMNETAVNKVQTIFSHLTVILSLMFVVFLILDQFNPMMNFIDNNISRWLLAALCVSGITQSVCSAAWQGKKD